MNHLTHEFWLAIASSLIVVSVGVAGFWWEIWYNHNGGEDAPEKEEK